MIFSSKVIVQSLAESYFFATATRFEQVQFGFILQIKYLIYKLIIYLKVFKNINM